MRIHDYRISSKIRSTVVFRIHEQPPKTTNTATGRNQCSGSVTTAATADAAWRHPCGANGRLTPSVDSLRRAGWRMRRAADDGAESAGGSSCAANRTYRRAFYPPDELPRPEGNAHFLPPTPL